MNRVVKERKQLLKTLESFFEIPLIVLGFVWLLLLVIDLVYGTSATLEILGMVIWGVFILDFILKFTLAPAKIAFLKGNILTILSLAVPAFRIFRVVRVLRFIRFTRSLRLVKVLGSVNRGMRALSSVMKRRAFGYIILLTLIVIFAGAAGMFAFEKDSPGGLKNYSTALWWTTMIITTLGSEYWPTTTEGRILCIILAIYAFAVFGYITATIATFFIGKDAESKNTEIAGSRQIEELKQEIISLKRMIQAINKNADQ
jgi:voltage-gated potassium channel